MQAVKEKLNDMSTMRMLKAEAKPEEKVEKEIAKARMEVAHEVRLAKEAQATMELHVAKAGQKGSIKVQHEILNILKFDATTGAATTDMAGAAAAPPTIHLL